MRFFNVYGLVILLLLLIPNLLYYKKHPEAFYNHYQNKRLALVEQIGRYGTFLLMIYNPTNFTLWCESASTRLLYPLVNGILLLFYWMVFIRYWKDNSIAKALALSITPTIIFIFSGVLLLNIALIVLGILFGFAHITISVKNSVQANK